MATKSGILATINGFITAIITQAKVRSAYSTVVDEIYPNVVTDSQLAETYTTKSGSTLGYSITMHKSGNQVFIQGRITNLTALLISPQNVFTWKDTAFKPKSGVNDFTFKAISGTSSVNLFVNNNVLSLTSSMPANGVYSFEYQLFIAQD
ncbi:MAG: hypothetical protein ACOVK2_03040 [Candidatus Fonsibacter sp.]